ncbi:MAG: SWF/SNF helicase family protein [Chitinophagaceae bacterium]|nr:SWF/SNF helicase family protein [Chitinophagaceae bacterium]
MSSCIVAFREERKICWQEYITTKLGILKFDAFRTILNEVVLKNGKKLIVFAFFTKTLLYLQAKLNEYNIKTEIIYGDIKNRTERIENFRINETIKVLLSSEVGEGLDMQFCDALVNYDLPESHGSRTTNWKN